MNRLLRLDEVQRRLGADARVIEKLIRGGILPALEIAPGQYRVLDSDLRRFIQIRRHDFAVTCSAVLAREGSSVP